MFEDMGHSTTTWYYYEENGNPTRIVTEEADYPEEYTAGAGAPFFAQRRVGDGHRRTRHPAPVRATTTG